jgi:putative inorganic carbon (HCO3(-)) transporter
MIRAHPLIGLGANTYMKNYKKYKESPEYRNVVTADTLYAHNNFLHLAAEVGLIGLLVFLWFLYQLFRGSILIYQRLSGYIQAVALSLIACLAAFLINGLTESSFYSSRVALIFWYLAGLMFGLAKLTYRDG